MNDNALPPSEQPEEGIPPPSQELPPSLEPLPPSQPPITPSWYTALGIVLFVIALLIAAANGLGQSLISPGMTEALGFSGRSAKQAETDIKFVLFTTASATTTDLPALGLPQKGKQDLLEDLLEAYEELEIKPTGVLEREAVLYLELNERDKAETKIRQIFPEDTKTSLLVDAFLNGDYEAAVTLSRSLGKLDSAELILLREVAQTHALENTVRNIDQLLKHRGVILLAWAGAIAVLIVAMVLAGAVLFIIFLVRRRELARNSALQLRPEVRWGLAHSIGMVLSWMVVGGIITAGFILLPTLGTPANPVWKVLVPQAFSYILTWLAVMPLIFRGRWLTRDELALRPPLRGNLILWTLGGLCVFVFIVLALGTMWASVVPPSLKAENLAQDIDMLSLSWTDRVVMLLIIGVLGPLFEELLLRGMLYRSLRRHGVVWAMVLSSFFFAVGHPVVNWLPIFGIGVTLAYVYEYTGSLYPSIAIHVINNSAVVILLFLTQTALRM